jgi:hypothetical protein
MVKKFKLLLYKSFRSEDLTFLFGLELFFTLVKRLTLIFW